MASETPKLELPPDYSKEVDLVSRSGGHGSLVRAASELLYGINHHGSGIALPINTDNHGLTFFTRPRMNLSYDNLAMDRVLTPLLSAPDYSYQRAIRVLLDPVGTNDPYRVDGVSKTRNVTSSLVDNKCAFIPMLSNTLLSLNGWPDPVVRYYDSKEGPAREQWTMVDDMPRNFSAFELNATFSNIAGDPITLLLNVWLRYMAGVYMGELMPYPDSILENEIDYQTRIYRLVLDPTKRFVQKIASANACFPLTSALGTAFDFSTDTPYNSSNAKQISVGFRCIGAEYQDPILIREFNDVVYFFNEEMAERTRLRTYTKLKQHELSFFKSRGYPRIDPKTLELEWWVPNNEYRETLADIKATLGVIPTAALTLPNGVTR